MITYTKDGKSTQVPASSEYVIAKLEAAGWVKA